MFYSNFEIFCRRIGDWFVFLATYLSLIFVFTVLLYPTAYLGFTAAFGVALPAMPNFFCFVMATLSFFLQLETFKDVLNYYYVNRKFRG